MARWNRAGTLTATVRQHCHQMQHDSLIEPNKILIKEKISYRQVDDINQIS